MNLACAAVSLRSFVRPWSRSSCPFPLRVYNRLLWLFTIAAFLIDEPFPGYRYMDPNSWTACWASRVENSIMHRHGPSGVTMHSWSRFYRSIYTLQRIPLRGRRQCIVFRYPSFFLFRVSFPLLSARSVYVHSNAFEDANRGQTMGSFGVSDVLISIHFVLCLPILRFTSFSTSINCKWACIHRCWVLAWIIQ